MDIEKRLEYLIHKRAELQKSILLLQKESLGISPETVINKKIIKNSKEETKLSLVDFNRIFEQLKGQKNKLIKIKKDGSSVLIEADHRLEKHAYVYFSDMWKVTEICDNSTLSVNAVTADDTEVRPLIVFYDQLRKKISHSFFVFNTPMRMEIPENTVYVTFGLRLESEMQVSLQKLQFHVQTLQELCDLHFLDRIQDKIDLVPISNGGRYYIAYDKPFGLIADRFLYDAYKDVGECICITPDNYIEMIDNLSFLIVASAWHGLNNEWDGMTKTDTEQGKAVFDVIKKAKEKEVPVVFYSKEDPPNYEHFVHIAKECDYIFTSAAEMIENYKKDCHNKNVDSLCFGINPILHNPIGICSVEPEEGVIFSGSWMAKYPDRIAKMEVMFDGILNSKMTLKIIDRNYDKNDPRYYFPQKYYRYVSPAIEHDTLQKVHKLFKWAVNINSVTDSSTMFANRVYELQAIGNILISNYSKGVSEKFDGVHIVNTEEDVCNVLKSMDDEELYYERIKNIRRVMTGETTYDRLAQIINTISLTAPKTTRKVAVVIPKNSPRLVEEFNKQSYSNKVMIQYKNLRKTLPNDIDIIAFWNDDFHYGEHYLEDMINGFKYTSCSYITKNSFYSKDSLINGTEHNYVTEYVSKYATVFWKNDYSIEELITLPEKSKLKNGYSIDHFELIKEK